MSGEAHFEVYPQRHDAPPGFPEGTEGALTGEFGWRFRAANGQISAVGGEGFATSDGANRAIHDFLDAVDPEGKGADRTHAPIIDVPE